MTPSMTLIQKVLAAYGNQRDPINDSDLDNEQPISLTVYMTLGELRAARRALVFAGHRPADFSTRHDDKIDKIAADLWREENPNMSVFACDEGMKNDYRNRALKLLSE